MPPARALAVDVAIVAVVVLLVRAATFWSEVIDWDVGLYLVVAREVLHGHLPYVTAWEIRPPGLFYLIALALALCKAPATAMAALGAVATFATSVALYASGRLFGERGRLIGMLAALLYALTSIEDDGLATNTEILFTPFVCWALYVVARAALSGARFDLRRSLAAGLLLAAALQMKLLVLPEAAFVAALACWWARGGARVATFIAGVTTLPFVLEAALWDSRGELPSFLDANLYATLRRAAVSTSAPRDNLARIFAQPLALAPASVLALLAPPAFARAPRNSPERRFVPVLALWLAVECATLLLVREFNDHQFLQVLAPLALLGAYGTVRAGAWVRRPVWAAVAAAAIAFGLHGYYQVVTAARLAYHRSVLHDATWREANVDAIAARIRRSPDALRTLFVLGETPIVYLLADAPLPTRLPFSLYLTDAEMWPLTGVPGPSEVARILLGRPVFILRSDSTFHVDARVATLVAGALARNYRPIATFEHDTLYERSDLPPL